MKKFEALILGDIRRHSMLQKGDSVLLALSGGPDSVCLTVLLDHLRSELKIHLEAGHVNYGLRGAESDRDETFVKELCEKLNITLHLKKADPSREGNLEEMARRQRYDFLSRIAVKRRMVIATGHNSDDQAETFLLNLTRGAGYRGLSGMLPVREHRAPEGKNCTVIRPLLRASRRQITDYLEEINQAFRTDQSNSSLEFDRNWIRHELLPRLEDRFNPGQADRIARASVLIGEAARFLEDEALRQLRAISGTANDGSLQIPIDKITSLPEVVQREMLRLAIGRIKGDLVDITSRHIYSLLDLLKNQSGRKINLPGAIEARISFKTLFISFPPKITPQFEYRLELPGRLVIPEAGKTLSMEPLSGPSKGETPEITSGMELIVRNRRPGDRLKISPKRPRQSFSNLCTQYRIPENERDRILIIEFPDGSHWVEGIGLPREISPNPGKNHLYKIRIEDSAKLRPAE